MNRLNPVALFLLTLTAPLAAQTSQPVDAALARRGIETGNAAYIAAFKRADAKALSQDLWLVGDTAYETGLWPYTSQPKGKPSRGSAAIT